LKILSRVRKPETATPKYKKIKSASLNLHKSASTVSIDGEIWGSLPTNSAAIKMVPYLYRVKT